MRRGEFNLMEYRGIRYTIRAGIERRAGAAAPGDIWRPFPVDRAPYDF
jgi:hypothetical protein